MHLTGGAGYCSEKATTPYVQAIFKIKLAVLLCTLIVSMFTALFRNKELICLIYSLLLRV